MKSATNIEKVNERIEALVNEYLAATRGAFVEAVQRAFGMSVEPPARDRAPRPSGTRKTGKRRTPEEVAALSERFYEAVTANPGEMMTTLAKKVGVSGDELHRPMTLLKRAGRVRSVGERSHTRYFPSTGRRAAG